MKQEQLILGFVDNLEMKTKVGSRKLEEGYPMAESG